MQEAFITFTVSLLICAVVIAILIPLSRKFNWLDSPDDRKQHETPTPAVGGFGVFIGVMVPIFWVSGITDQTLGFFAGSSLLVMVGAFDDRYDINWKIRILAQICAALAMIFISGVRAEHVGTLFGFGEIELGWLSIPFTIFVTLGLINAMNMFDGIDGLVGSVCFAGLCMFIAAALYAGSPVMEINQFIVLGALAGFLLFNMRFPWQPRAKTFLGDAGSGFVGFTLAYIAISLTQPVNHPISPVLGPFLLAPPIIDCLVLIAHRMRKGKSPFCAGRDHVHHLMLEAGFGVTQIVAILTGLSCISGLFGALCMLLNVPAPLMVMAYLTAIFIWFWITETEQRAISYFQWLQKRFSVLFNVKSPA